jgi:hypothetical protein
VAWGITYRKRRRSMLPHDEELLSDRGLREASIEQLENVRAGRVATSQTKETGFAI